MTTSLKERKAALAGGPTHRESNGNNAASFAQVKMAAFTGCTETKTKGELTPLEVVDVIRGLTLVELTEQVRLALARADGNKKDDAVHAAKLKLPCVSISGTGAGHKDSDMREHSGLVQMDFDGPKRPKVGAPEQELSTWRDGHAEWLARLPELRLKLEGCRHVAIAFTSATGTGIKGALRVEIPDGLSPEEIQRWHKEAAFPAVQRFARETFGAEIDAACSNPMRLAFLAHDPAVYYNAEALALPINADNADSAGGGYEKTRPRLARALQLADRREGFAKWAAGQGFTGDLRTLDLHGLLEDHGISVAERSKGLSVRCLWHNEHSTGSNGTDTLLLHSGDPQRFRWSFKCQHEHCQRRTIRDVLEELETRKPGSVDARCGKAYTQSQPHEELEENESVTAPPFPVEALNPIARRIVEDSADIAGVDTALTGAVALAAIAASIGKGAVARGGTRDLSKQTPANVYVIPSFPTGYGKTAAEPVIAPLREINNRLQEKFDREERGKLETELAECEAAQKRITRLMAGGEWRKEAPDKANATRKELTIANTRAAALREQLAIPPQRIIGSAPGAALAQAMKRNNECLFSFGYESGDIVRIALGRFTKDGRGDCDLLLCAYTGDAHHENRVSRANIRLERPNLTSLWLCQPTILTEILSSTEARERGMLNRMIYAIRSWEHIPHEAAEARQPDLEARKLWAEAIEKINAELFVRIEPLEFVVSPEAREIFRELHNKSVDDRNGGLRDESDIISRIRENAIRLSLGQAVLDYVTGSTALPTIEADHARRGVDLVNWSVGNLLAFLGPARYARRQQRFTALITVLQKSRGELTLRLLRDNHGFGKEEVHDLARRFPSHIRIESKGPRRPSEVALLVQATEGGEG